MPKFSREKLFSAQGLFFLYILASSLVILCFRLFVPGESAPLAYFSRSWRLLRGGTEIIRLFPALAFTGLVIPFGFRPKAPEKFSSFSPHFLKSLSPSVFCAIGAAAVYALLFLLVQPLLLNYEGNLQAQGRLYRLSEEKARSHASLDEWKDAAHFVDICESIWPKGPDIAALRTEAEIRLAEISERPLSGSRPFSPSRGDISGVNPVSAAEALALAESALKEERYYDAHWLASLGGDLASPGSAESAAAVRIASQAWNAVSSMEPNSRQTEVYRIYSLKRDAYRALVSGEYISAYYLFLELDSLTPEDPDAGYYLSLSEQGLVKMAFFVDEMDLDENSSGAIMSLPLGTGRMVMRFASLSVHPDSAYGLELEILAFDRYGRPLWRMEAPYAKILPFSLDSGPQVSLLMAALDRSDSKLRWGPTAQGMGEAAPQNPQLTLDLHWDDFLLLSEMRRGPDTLSPRELIAASRSGANYGYLPQLFEAELVSRFAEPALFLPLLIFCLAVGWRYRAVKRPRYMWVPMLGILPLVFSGGVHFVRSCLDNVSVWTVINFGFSSAAIIFSAFTLVIFLLSLIYLASQHG